MDGAPVGRLQKAVFRLPVPDDALTTEGMCRWPFNVELEEACERQDDMTVRHVPSAPAGRIGDAHR